MKRRLFIAINLREDIKNKLVEYQKKWANLPVRWTIKPNLHITLVFIGCVGDDEMYEICNIVKTVARRHNPFMINLKKIVLGPFNKSPRMFWVEGERNEEIAKLKNDLEDLILKSREVRAFRPHITLGRIKQSQWRKLDFKPEIDEKFEHSFPVETIEVMQSNLKRTGPEYSVLESVELGL